MATVVLTESKTGRPLAIMDGTYITNMRTGATDGIAAKYHGPRYAVFKRCNRFLSRIFEKIITHLILL